MTADELKNLCDTIRNLDASVDELRIIRNAVEETYFEELVHRRYLAEIAPVSITCPVCEQTTDVYHFEWAAITCGTCQNMVYRSQWRLAQDDDEQLPF